MERENMFMNEGNNTMPYGMGMSNELNGTSEQLQSCFFNPTWDNSMDQNDPFESALSSMVSSPVTSHAAAAPPGSASENIVLRELIGKLGSICNTGELSPHSYINGGNSRSTNTSCYSTPLNSPPKLNLSMMDHQIRGSLPFPGNHLPSPPSLAPLSADPGFAERAARFSCFANKSLGGLNGHLGFNDSELPHRFETKLDSGKLSRVSSNQSLKVSGSMMNVQENKDGNSLQDVNSAADQKFSRLSRSSTPENTEFGDSRENSSVSEQIPVGEAGISAQNDVNSRKRKSISKGKGKGKDIPSSTSAKDADAAAENNESNAKRSKSDNDNANEKDPKSKAEQNGPDSVSGDGNKKESKDNQKPPEAPKDYIHVRARRGQATDAHSLAERVRREKISQRMKHLQDLVPGCNKVTGKAVMLDEIINYVQSLQRQVEFLSMKLATINPRMDVNIEALLSKDMFQPCGSLPHGTYPTDTSASAFPFPFQSQQVPNLHNPIPNGTEVPLSMNHMNAAMGRNPSMQSTPVDSYSEAPSQASTFWEDDLQSVVFGQIQTQNFHGNNMSSAQMKVEL